MISFQYLLAVTLIPVTLCEIFEAIKSRDPGEDPTTCSGSLVITNTDGEETKFDSNETLQGEVTNIKRPIRISTVRVEGCGCFYVFSKTKGRGNAELIESGEKWFAEEFGFSKARSLEQVSCEMEAKNAMPVWGVVLTVLVLVALVAIAALIFIRMRKYQEVNQNPS